jgi:hypothetical protein
LRFLFVFLITHKKLVTRVVWCPGLDSNQHILANAAT